MGSFSGVSRWCSLHNRVAMSAAAVIITSAGLGTNAAHADVYGYEWNRPAVFDGTAGPIYVSDEAGVIQYLTTEYDADNEELTFFATFEPEPVTGQLPLGFFLVINDGPDPKGIDGEYAILYFDAVTAGGPVITAYAYNGENGADSFFDGELPPGNQPPDPIISSLNDPSLIISASSVNDSGTQALSFTIDTAAINAHIPAYGSSANWKGIGFDENIGIWMHSYSLLNPSYGVDGFLEQEPNGSSWMIWSQYGDLGEQFHGWFDVSNQPTEVLIPEPASLVLIGLGVAALSGRRGRDRY